MFLLAFTITLIASNIIAFKKNRYLNVFIPSILFLPQFYGIEFSEEFPILSASRMITIVFFMYAVVNRKKSFGMTFRGMNYFQETKRLMLCLSGYFLFRIIANLHYIYTNNQALKTIMSLLLEQILVVVSIYLLRPSREDINEAILVTTNIAGVMFLLGIVESIFEFRPADYLYTVSRTMLNEHFYRMDVLRATATLGLPGFYGNMCVLMIPFIVYCFRITSKLRYLILGGLCGIAIVHSGSRSDIFFGIFTLTLIAVYLFRKDEWRKVLLRYVVVLVCVIMFFCFIAIFSERFRYFYTGTAKSVLNEVGFDFNLDEGAPEGAGGYGENADGTYSRVRQLTGIKYVLMNEPIFGLGAEAQKRGQVMYYSKFGWTVVRTYDVGYVQVMMDEGIVGTMGYCLLFAFVFGGLACSIVKQQEIDYMLFLYALTYLCCMFSTANMDQYLIVLYVLVFARIIDIKASD